MISDKALRGLPLDDIFIFDVHGHLGRSSVMHQGKSYGDDLVKEMDQLGIDKICVSSNMSFESDYLNGNILTGETTDKHYGRIYGYAVPTPYYEECDLSDFFDKYKGIIGMKIHALCNLAANSDPRYEPYMEYADKHELPVLFHAWSPVEVADIVRLAAKYKNAKIILGHAGLVEYASKLNAIEGCKKYENVYVDTALSNTYDGAIEWIVGKVGADRVLYGSDLPFFDCRQNLGKLALANLKETDKIKIFGENAKKLFKL